MTFLGDCFSLIFKSTNNLYFKYSKWELQHTAPKAMPGHVCAYGPKKPHQPYPLVRFFFQVEVQAKFLHFFANLLIYLMSFQSGQTI